MKTTLIVTLAAFALVQAAVAADSPASDAPKTKTDNRELQPLMLVPDKVIFADDFSTPRGELKKTKATESDAWVPNQGTRWVVEDGVLRGRASSAEYQASHQTHKGLHPRIVLTKPPENYVLRFSMRLVEGKPFEAGQRRSISPFIEMGHHIARITWSAEGAMLLADGDSLQIASAPGFKLETGRWYQVMVERRDDEVLVQFADGPTLHGKHPTYKSDKHAVMLGGLEAGVMEVDNVTLWSIKDESQQKWSETLAKFPAAQSVRIKPAKTESTKEKTK